METTTTETKPSRYLTEAARCAADIRRVLKAAFPQTKFRVTSSNFSMGNSVDVRWTDGPAANAVEALVGRFREGRFDGSIDMYVSSDDDDATVPNRAKFVSCDRDISAAIKTAVAADMKARYSADTSEDYVGNVVYQLLRASDLSGGYGGLHRSDRGWEIIEASPIVRGKVAA